MAVPLEPGYLPVVSLAGLAGGMALFARGLVAYRTAAGVTSIASSPIEAIAAGEVRVVGTIEPGVTTLVSPLQSEPCVYYRARVSRDEGRTTETLLDEERSVSFRLRDDTGVIVVFPRGAHWDVPDRFSGDTGITGGAPPGLRLNSGPTMTMAATDRDMQVADLLAVHQPDEASPSTMLPTDTAPLVGGRVRYRERRVGVGDVVTVIGAALPFGQIPDDADDPTTDQSDPVDDPEIAADLERAEAGGRLASTAEAAWGNAAIPGFGIGHPTRAPRLDPAATPEAVAPATGSSDARHAVATSAYAVAPDELVLATAADRGMHVFAGSPTEASGRAQRMFWIGVGGGVLATISALLLAISLGIG